MKQHGKQILPLILVLGILWLLSGCGLQQSGTIIFSQEQQTAQEQTSITYFGYKADTLNLIAIESALQSFMSQHDYISVEYESVKGGSYWTALERRSKTNRLDDVFMIDHDHVLEMSANGQLEDLSDLSTIDCYMDTIAEQFTNADGTVYFLPTCISAYGLYINYDLLEEQGQKIPENLSEFAAICDSFVSLGVTPIIVNNYASLRHLILARSMYDVYHVADTDTEIEKFNQDGSLLAETLRPGVELLEEMIQRGWIDCHEALVTEQTSDDLELFLQGERPFMVTGGWASLRVADENPDFSYGVYPFPVLDDGSVLNITIDTCIAVNAGSEHLDMAQQLVEHLTSLDTMELYCDSQSSFLPTESDWLPSDTTVAPLADNLLNDRWIFGADYRLTLPLDSAILEMNTQILNGMGTEDAITLLTDLLTQSGEET